MIIVLISFFVKLYYLLNLFQKSFYEYKSLFKLSIKKYILLNFSTLILFLSSIFRSHFLFLFLFVVLIFEIIYIIKKVKVQLSFTKRIMRLIITCISLNVLFSFFISIWILHLLVPILIVVSDILNKPYELFINRRFINKAKIKSDSITACKIAITGSYGKTSTKNYIKDVLKNKYIVKASPKSYNTPLGLSKFINENDFNYTDFVVYEFGARRKGDIYELAKIFKYDIAIVTSIGSMHIDTFKCIDVIVNEKMSICSYLKEDGFAILNYENRYIRNYPINNKKYTYGFNYGMYQAKNIKLSIFNSTFDLYKNGEFVKTYTIKPLGKGAVLNVLPSIILCDLNGIDFKHVQKIDAVTNRLSLRDMGNYYILDDAYNSNLMGATYALEVLNSHDGMKYLITPGFIEMDKIKEELAEEYALNINKCCDYVFLVKNNFTVLLSKFITVKYEFVKTFKKGFKSFLSMKEDNSILLIENDLYE